MIFLLASSLCSDKDINTTNTNTDLPSPSRTKSSRNNYFVHPIDGVCENDQRNTTECDGVCFNSGDNFYCLGKADEFFCGERPYSWAVLYGIVVVYHLATLIPVLVLGKFKWRMGYHLSTGYSGLCIMTIVNSAVCVKYHQLVHIVLLSVFCPVYAASLLFYCGCNLETKDSMYDLQREMTSAKPISNFRNDLNHFKTAPPIIYLDKYYDDDDAEHIENIQYKNWKDATDAKPLKGKGIFLVEFAIEPKFAGNFKEVIDKKIASIDLDADEAVKVNVTCSYGSGVFVYHHKSCFQRWVDIYMECVFFYLYALGIGSATLDIWNIMVKRHAIPIVKIISDNDSLEVADESNDTEAEPLRPNLRPAI